MREDIGKHFIAVPLPARTAKEGVVHAPSDIAQGALGPPPGSPHQLSSPRGMLAHLAGRFAAAATLSRRALCGRCARAARVFPGAAGRFSSRQRACTPAGFPYPLLSLVRAARVVFIQGAGALDEKALGEARAYGAVAHAFRDDYEVALLDVDKAIVKLDLKAPLDAVKHLVGVFMDVEIERPVFGGQDMQDVVVELPDAQVCKELMEAAGLPLEIDLFQHGPLLQIAAREGKARTIAAC